MGNRLLGSLVFSATVMMATQASASILPPNNLNLQDKMRKFNTNGMTEQRFNELIDKVNAVYAPIVTNRGGSLKFSRRWTDSTVNASATQMFGSWYVTMYGGLARRDEITPDGFTIVICHELGHHLAGFPFVSTWGANEGQADYFASQACARELWGKETEENATHAATVDATAKAACDESWESEADRNLCYRTADAVKSTSNLLAVLGQGTVSFATPDTSVVTKTDNAHPAAQCRLDTYFAGALCGKAFDRELIPGKRFSDKGGIEAEREAASKSCHTALGDTVGVRSRCWFAPRATL